MDPAAFDAFTRRLLSRLQADPDVLGLVLLGSASGLPPLPDEWSDHDLFVVVKDGAQERFREDRSWLPDAERIVLAFRETPHGVKALWDDGHLAEYAVFSTEELTLARVNRYRVVLDRADVGARMERVREETAGQARGAAPDARWSAGMFLGALGVGAGRWARGERLSGQHLVRCAAVGHLVSLLRAGLPPERRVLLDDLDPLRRLERALPLEAAEIDAALLLPLPAAARTLLGIARRSRPDVIEGEAVAAVERLLAEAEGAVPATGRRP
jgi:hypothetical protein